MKKKVVRPVVKVRAMTADEHRKIAGIHRAKGHLHEAKADIIDAANPPKTKSRLVLRGL